LTLELLSILCIITVVTVSGVVINLRKRQSTVNLLHVRDGHTLLFFRLGIPLALAASFVFYWYSIGHANFNKTIFSIGFGLVVFGLAIRWIAVYTLGKYFTVQVSILKNHQLKTDGLYRLIRHPSYTGLLLYYFGLGLMMGNWVSLALLVATPVVIVLGRIKTEETALLAHFGENYERYKKKTSMLFPFVF